jgi:hypothetical protein
LAVTNILTHADFYPEVFERILLPSAVDRLAAAEQELAARAAGEPDGCWGYYPDIDGAPELPESKRFAGVQPHIFYDSLAFSFSWLRYSRGREGGTIPTYHLDANRAEGFADETSSTESLVPSKEIWRLLYNLHDSAPRDIAYLTTPPTVDILVNRSGVIGLRDYDEIDPFDEQILTIPPRQGSKVWGARLCVSRVLHAGMETADGHFLASYTAEVAA